MIKQHSFIKQKSMTTSFVPYGGNELPLYEGRKQVQATPMSKHEYLKSSNKESIPSDLDQPGYLVIYKDGYKSWSPQNVFDEAYNKCGSHLDRMRIEYNELLQKFDKLTLFLSKDNKEDIAGSCFAIDLMWEQRSHMRQYLRVLKKRIEIEELKTANE